MSEFITKLPESYDRLNLDKDIRISIDVPIPEYGCVDDYGGELCSSGIGILLDVNKVRDDLKQFIHNETEKYEDDVEDKAILNAFQNWSSNQPVFKTNLKTRGSSNLQSFAEKFKVVVTKCSCESLLALMKMEVTMKKEMSDMIRARNWEVDNISKQCERILELDQDHPHQISSLNEKLRQVYTTYANHVADLAESQRLKYRNAVDLLFENGELPNEWIEEINFDNLSLSSSSKSTESQNNTIGLNESFTIYIGAQLKSMHNACLVTVDNLTDLCRTLEGDWTISTRLEMATKLYGRSLAAMTLLVSRDPMYHVNSTTQFYKICEQSTELHFEPLAEQLKQVALSSRRGNSWRADSVGKSLKTVDTAKAALRCDSTMSYGDVYCTKHSNLHKMQIVFHLVVDDMLQTSDIKSSDPSLIGIRNIIRMTTHYGITSIHLPLLLIDRPNEYTTISWCVKRAEMVYKCVKGYLMEVCSGTNIEQLPHYNVHFVVPSGLAPTVYTTISNMFPTIYHLVPSVSITM